MENHERSYLPAAGRDWLLPLYDPFNWILGGDALRRVLVEQAAITSACRGLEVGCGTGSLTVLIKTMHPQVDVVGLDPDPKARAIAKRKAERAGLTIAFDQGFGDRLPYADASFERVFSSFMFHHLKREEKLAMMREVRRVLTRGGSLHLVDLGPPRSAFARALGGLLHRSEDLEGDIDARITGVMAEAGLVEPEVLTHRSRIIGGVGYYRART